MDEYICDYSPKYMKQCLHKFIIAIYISLTVNNCCYIILSCMAPYKSLTFNGNTSFVSDREPVMNSGANSGRNSPDILWSLLHSVTSESGQVL